MQQLEISAPSESARSLNTDGLTCSSKSLDFEIVTAHNKCGDCGEMTEINRLLII